MNIYHAQMKFWDTVQDATYVVYKLTGSFHVWGFLMACSRKGDEAYKRMEAREKADV